MLAGGGNSDDDEDDDDDDDLDAESATSEQLNAADASCYVDHLFRTAKLGVINPDRWRRFFLGLAAREEARLSRLREECFSAATLNDLGMLVKMKEDLPIKLWKFYGFYLGLVDRAIARRLPEQLRVLPELYGECYPTIAEVEAAREALDHRPAAGSSEALLERQRGELLISVVGRAFEQCCEVDLEGLRKALDHQSAGPWRTSVAPARGVNFGADRGMGNLVGWRPLHFVAATPAARRTGVQAAAMLLEARADASLADGSGATPLHAAATQKNEAMIQVLLEGGAGLELRNHDGCSALLAAARVRNHTIVRRLALWAVPEDVGKPLVTTSGELAAEKFSFASCVRLLAEVAEGNKSAVRKGVVEGNGKGGELADVNFVDTQGRRAIHIAVEQTSGEDKAVVLVRALVSYRADLDCQDVNGQTPLHLAARHGRTDVARALLALRAHAGVRDNAGFTPLMLAAEAREDARAKLPYDGVPMNAAAQWSTIRKILAWDGNGEPPVHLARAAMRAKRVAMSRVDAARARAEVLADFGFDDQHILDAERRVNRGDRLRFAETLVDKGRCREVWRSIVAPLLPLHAQGKLRSRLSQFVQYLLMVLLGDHGDVFGVLLTVGVCPDKALPEWVAISGALDVEDLGQRIANLHDLGFRRGLPKKGIWAGSVWKRDEMPREPASIPWGAFDYVDRETAKELNRPRATTDEAYRDSHFPLFEDGPSGAGGEAARLPNRGDQLQLANKLFVVEALGSRGVDQERARRLGAQLLVPLLVETAEALAAHEFFAPGSVEALVGRTTTPFEGGLRWDFLRYLAGQMAALGPGPEGEARQTFHQEWQLARRHVAGCLRSGARPELAGLRSQGPGAVPGFEHLGPDVQQADIISEEDSWWLHRRNDARAYVQLVRSGCVDSSGDFCNVVCDIAVQSPGNFFQYFWSAAFYLLLWGNAKRLKPVLRALLEAKLPEGAVVQEVRLRTREDMIKAAAPPKVAEAPWKKKPGGTVAGSGALAAASMRQTAALPADAKLPSGPSDVLRARIVCSSLEAFVGAFEAICPPDGSGSLGPPSTSSGSDALEEDKKEEEEEEDDDTDKKLAPSFVVLRTDNSFAQDDPAFDVHVETDASSQWGGSSRAGRKPKSVFGGSPGSAFGGSSVPSFMGRTPKTVATHPWASSAFSENERSWAGVSNGGAINRSWRGPDMEPYRAFPRAGGVIFYGCVSLPRKGGVTTNQLVEVDLLLEGAAEARWLRDYCELNAEEAERWEAEGQKLREAEMLEQDAANDLQQWPGAGRPTSLERPPRFAAVR